MDKNRVHEGPGPEAKRTGRDGEGENLAAEFADDMRVNRFTPPPDPEPWWRFILRGVIGAIGGVIAVKIIGPDYQDAGLIGTAVISFFGGVALGSISDGLMGVVRGGARA